jgi:hypothetical protein
MVIDRLLTPHQLAKATGVAPLMLRALSAYLSPYRVGRRYRPAAAPVVALADELAQALRDGRLPERVAARLLARARRTAQ